MAHILIICTANICRSPLVEAMLRRDLHEDQGRAHWTVSSAGTWALRERTPARYSIKLAKRIDLDISEHIAKMVTGEMLEKSDLVLVMTKGHKESLQVEFPNQRHKIFLMTEMVGKGYDVVDPYGGKPPGYEDMFVEVTGLLTNGLAQMISIASTNAAQRITT